MTDNLRGLDDLACLAESTIVRIRGDGPNPMVGVSVGPESLFPGDTCDVPVPIARRLLLSGKAELVEILGAPAPVVIKRPAKK